MPAFYVVLVGLSLAACPASSRPPPEFHASALLGEAERSAEDVPQPDQHLWLLRDLAILHARFGDRDRARQLCRQAVALLEKAEEAGTLDEENLRWLRIALPPTQARIGDVRGALETIDAIAPQSGRELLLVGVAGACTEQGDIAGARAAVLHLPENGDAYHRAMILSGIVDAEARRGDFDSARKTLRELSELTDDDPQLRRLLHATELAARRRMAVGLARHRRLPEALAAVAAIDAPHQRIVTLSDIATDLAARGNRSAATEVFSQAIEVAEREESRDDLAWLVTRLAELGDAAEVISLTTRHPEILDACCNRLFVAAANAQVGNAGQARTMFEEGLRLVRDATDEDRAWLGAAAAAHARAGEVDRALAVARIVADESSRQSALGSIVQAILERQDDRRAWEIADEVRDSHVRNGVFLAIGQYEAGRSSERARRALREAFAAATRIPVGGGSDVLVLCESGAAQLRAGFRDDARTTLDEARRRAHEYADAAYVAQMLHHVARAQSGAGDVECALQWARRESTPLARSRALLGVLGGVAPGKDLEE